MRKRLELIVSSDRRNIVNADNVKGFCIVEDYKDEMYVVFADDYELSFYKTIEGAKKATKGDVGIINLRDIW